MTADADRVLARIDATLEGHGGIVEDYSVSRDAMRWATDQPDIRRPGAWPDAILAEARQRCAESFSPLGGEVVLEQPLTMGEIEALLAAYRPLPATRLRCHPSVISGLAMRARVAEWPSVPAGMVQIEIYADTDMAHGAWELRRGDEIVDQGVIA